MSVVWYDFNENNFDIYGMNSQFHRLPDDFAKTVSECVAYNSKFPAGGRIRFKTDSKSIHIKATMNDTSGIGFDLYRMVSGREIFAAGFKNSDSLFICNGEFEAEAAVSDGDSLQSYTLNFPYFGEVLDFKLGIDEGAKLCKGEKYVNEKPVLFYGSSITHGAWASRPGCAYVNMISQKYNLNYLNLGFSGGAKGEPVLVEYMAGLDISAFVSDYDHNAYDIELLKSTHLAMYKAVRSKNPEIPYIIVTRPDYWTAPKENDERTEIIYATYKYAKAEGDKNVYFIDGKNLFGGEYYHNCTKDGCHPNDLGAYRMSKGIGRVTAEVMDIPENNAFDTEITF